MLKKFKVDNKEQEVRLQVGSVIFILNTQQAPKHIKLRSVDPDDNEMKGKEKTCTEINCLFESEKK